jgi:hypothetical protein
VLDASDIAAHADSRPLVEAELGFVPPDRPQPRGEVCLNEPHPLVGDASRGEPENVRGRVDGGDVGRMPQQLPGPHAGPAGQLQDAPGRPEGGYEPPILP